MPKILRMLIRKLYFKYCLVDDPHLKGLMLSILPDQFSGETPQLFVSKLVNNCNDRKLVACVHIKSARTGPAINDPYEIEFIGKD